MVQQGHGPKDHRRFELWFIYDLSIPVFVLEFRDKFLQAHGFGTRRKCNGSGQSDVIGLAVDMSAPPDSTKMAASAHTQRTERVGHGVNLGCVGGFGRVAKLPMKVRPWQCWTDLRAGGTEALMDTRRRLSCQVLVAELHTCEPLCWSNSPVYLGVSPTNRRKFPTGTPDGRELRAINS